jgi:hypothetical protein
LLVRNSKACLENRPLDMDICKLQCRLSRIINQTLRKHLEIHDAVHSLSFRVSMFLLSLPVNAEADKAFPIESVLLDDILFCARLTIIVERSRRHDWLPRFIVAAIMTFSIGSQKACVSALWGGTCRSQDSVATPSPQRPAWIMNPMWIPCSWDCDRNPNGECLAHVSLLSMRELTCRDVLVQWPPGNLNHDRTIDTNDNVLMYLVACSMGHFGLETRRRAVSCAVNANVAK